jgi:hypothetical protein
MPCPVLVFLMEKPDEQDAEKVALLIRRGRWILQTFAST